MKTGEFLSHLKNLEMLYPEKAGLFDDVTMLFNRRYLKIRLTQEINRSARYSIPLVILMIDVDRFDNYLSRKGEYYGNLMLKKLTELLRRSTRSSDVVARYDRNSFALILTNTFIDAGASLAKRFISMVHDYPFLYEEVQPGGRVTVSIGAVAFKKGNTLDDIIKYAETSLSDAHKKGGNRLEVYTYTNL
ncbi:MAG: GGDEF domain-containing protein [Deltaproteobacteria bacterium]|nr:GGDEF domain-containing protein [Deltaproteobacteria bacterium]